MTRGSNDHAVCLSGSNRLQKAPHNDGVQVAIKPLVARYGNR